MNGSRAPEADEDLLELAVKAHVWGYPLVRNLGEIGNLLRGRWPHFPDAELNRFSHMRVVSGPQTRFVSPNVDVLFSIAVCNLADGPIVLRVGDSAGRYYVLQFLDPWTHNFAYVGRRATGTQAGQYLIAPPGYQGPVPQGMVLIRAPAPLFAIVGRVAVDDEHHLEEVHRVQDGFELQPLLPSRAAVSLATSIPQPDPTVAPALRFWERLRVLLPAFPPPAADLVWMQQLAPLGLLQTRSPYADADPALARTLVAAEQEARRKMDAAARNGLPVVNGWSATAHSFDYNLDFFELGTRNEARWKMSDRAAAHRQRALATRFGLWGNHGYEAAFFQVWVDAAAQQLNGAHRYEWTLPKPPPARAFWSLTMYDVPDFYLVANSIQRYCISGATRGLRFADDGSLTLTIQHMHPGPDKQANWLPSPPGDFRPLLSMFEPQDEALDPGFVLPAIRRLD